MTSKHFSAGENQKHIIVNAFNILSNRGFLRDQGILTLEAVQEFYKLIRTKPKNAKMVEENVLNYCKRPNRSVTSEATNLDIDVISQHRPVMTLMKNYKIVDEATGKEILDPSYHAVALESYVRNGNVLTLTTIDSLSDTGGETTIKCTVSIDDRGNEFLETCNETEKWCLGHEKCYYFELQ